MKKKIEDRLEALTERRKNWIGKKNWSKSEQNEVIQELAEVEGELERMQESGRRILNLDEVLCFDTEELFLGIMGGISIRDNAYTYHREQSIIS